MTQAPMITTETYNAYSAIPAQARTPEIQAQMDAYAEAQKHVVESEVESATAQVKEVVTTTSTQTESSVEEPTMQAEELSEVTVEAALQCVSGIETDAQTAEVFNSFNTQFDRFSPRLADDNLQNLVAISQLANSFSKYNPHHLVLTATDEETAKKLVKIRSLLDFDYVVSDREDSYAIQGDLVKAPYGTHGIYLNTDIKTANTFKHHPEFKEIKYGSKFIVCTGTANYSPTKTDLIIAYIKNAVTFNEGSAPEDIDQVNDKTDINMMLHKIKRQTWRDAFANKVKTDMDSEAINELTKHLRPSIAKAWKSFLVIAKMISEDVFKSIYKLMEQYGSKSDLDQAYSVYVAVKLALPEYEAYVNKFGFQQVVSIKTIEQWVKHYGQTVTSKKVLDSLTVEGQINITSNNFCLGINTSGFKIEDLKKFVEAQLNTQNKRVIDLIEKMQEPSTKVQQKAA